MAWDTSFGLSDFTKSGSFGTYNPSSSAVSSIGGSGVDYNQNTSMNFVTDPVGSMNFMKYGWGDGGMQSLGGQGGSSGGFSLGDIAGLVGSFMQWKTAKDQLKLGKEQLAASKLGYAQDFMAQADQYNREWANRANRNALMGGPINYAAWGITDPNVIAQSEAAVAANRDRWLNAGSIPLSGSTNEQLLSWGAEPSTTAMNVLAPSQQLATELSAYGKQPAALTDQSAQQTQTTSTNTAKKPEEQKQ